MTKDVVGKRLFIESLMIYALEGIAATLTFARYGQQATSNFMLVASAMNFSMFVLLMIRWKRVD